MFVTERFSIPSSSVECSVEDSREQSLQLWVTPEEADAELLRLAALN